MRQPFAPPTCPSYGPKQRNHGKSTLRRSRRDEPKRLPARRRNSRPIVGAIGRVRRGHIAVRQAIPGPLRPPLQYAVIRLLLLTSACCQGRPTTESIPLQGRRGKRRFLIAKRGRKTPFGNRHLRCIAAPRFPFAVAHSLFLHLACRPPLLCGRCRWRTKQGCQLVSAGVTRFALLDSVTLVSERLCFALHAPQLICCPLRPLFFD